ncbi:hypothetical protein L596_029910 [Steinernema carpocapsae]|uniref:G-protein coupled receptors family 1 profile domain-containing protein n=1 Tax=Steinernema carpocapsae TaxID=34508 RepID=A0A4U5LR62_STECR|nr:hypothetical protein L596_029910 [Steinernema carpocapsae]
MLLGTFDHLARIISVVYSTLASISIPLGVISIILILKTTPREQRTFGYYLVNLHVWTIVYDVFAGIAVKPVFRSEARCILSFGDTRRLTGDYSLDMVVLTMQFLVINGASLLSLVAHRYGIHIFNTFTQVFIGKRSFFVAYFLHILPSVGILTAFVFLDFSVQHSKSYSEYCSNPSQQNHWSLTNFLVVLLCFSVFLFAFMLIAIHQIMFNLETSRGIMRTRTFSQNIKTTKALTVLIGSFLIFRLLPLAFWVATSWVERDLSVLLASSHLFTTLGSIIQTLIVLSLIPPYPTVIVKIARWLRIRFPRNKLSYVQNSESIKY